MMYCSSRAFEVYVNIDRFIQFIFVLISGDVYIDNSVQCGIFPKSHGLSFVCSCIHSGGESMVIDSFNVSVKKGGAGPVKGFSEN